MIISIPHQFNYIAIPRTASTSLYHVLQEKYGAMELDVQGGHFHHDHRVVWNRGWINFTVVRHPLDRFMSLWSWVRRKSGEAPGISLKDFPYLVVSKKLPNFLRCTQSSLIPSAGVKYILRYEELPDCLGQLPFWDAELPQMNVSETRDQELPSQDMEWLRSYYWEDFSRFGYS